MRIDIIAMIIARLETAGIHIPLKLAYLIAFIVVVGIVALCYFGFLPPGFGSQSVELLTNYTGAPENLSGLANLTT